MKKHFEKLDSLRWDTPAAPNFPQRPKIRRPGLDGTSARLPGRGGWLKQALEEFLVGTHAGWPRVAGKCPKNLSPVR